MSALTELLKNKLDNVEREAAIVCGIHEPEEFGISHFNAVEDKIMNSIERMGEGEELVKAIELLESQGFSEIAKAMVDAVTAKAAYEVVATYI